MFFDGGCGVDETVGFLEKNDSSPYFDLKIQAFFFASAPSTAVYFHVDIYICKQDDRTTADCIQKPQSECPSSRRKRRSALQSFTGPLEKRRVSSNQHLVFNEKDIFHLKCSKKFVYDRIEKMCATEKILKVKGISLDIPWKGDLENTSSKAFKDFAITGIFVK